MNSIDSRLLPYRTFLASQKQQLEAEIQELERQNRCDEAAMQKIRLNIFGVFETVAEADKKASADWASFCQRYEPRFEILTAPWQKRLEAALRNGDSHTRFVEETKLGTANAIRSAFAAAKEC